MYQNASSPPQQAYSTAAAAAGRGGYSQQVVAGGGGGYGYENTVGGGGGGNNNGGAYPIYGGGAPSPVNSAYLRANVAMSAVRGPTPNVIGGGSGTTGGGASSGLIRLTLRKPMGIVFEPMTDPHNPSQQRGVRICDLPRTGAAAMSQKLELGDELLSINDKTMSRLTFDEIMDFIIEADKERVDLLFRRPNRNKESGTVGAAAGVGVGGNAAANVTAGAPTVDASAGGLPPIGNGYSSAGGGGPVGGVPGNGSLPLSPMGLGGFGSNSNSVKWIDEKSDKRGKLTEEVNDVKGKKGDGGGSGSRGKPLRNDDVSVDDTYNDGYTVESQSQYTMETYEEEQRHRGNIKSSGRGGTNDHDHKSKRKSSYKDPVESMGFLDMLIDTLCTSVMGRHAQDMCGDDDQKKNHNTSNIYGGEDFDDEFTLDDGTYGADDGTYATYEENEERRGRHRRMGEDESIGTMEDEQQTYVTNDDEEIANKKKQQIRDDEKKSKDLKKALASSSKSKSKVDNALLRHHGGNEVDGRLMDSTPRVKTTAPDPPPTKQTSSQGWNDARAMNNTNAPANQSWLQQQGQQQQPQQQQQHQQLHHNNIVEDHQMNEQESAINSAILPVRELEYDDCIDYAADVSVMESLGGPSLLVERARHENAVYSGAHQALYENLDRQDPELANLVIQHGEGFLPDPGMTREETAFRDPYKFYEFAVCALLKENEPEKVRLLSKLMAKYRGRERHLINKLSARYDKNGNAAAALEARGNEQGAAAAVAPTTGNAPDSLSNKGMEKIHEADEGEEVSGSSVLNDPSRANLAVIEAAKKKMNVNTSTRAATTERKLSNDDGWPPAMSDPWGISSKSAVATRDEARDVSEEGADRHIDDDEGSYSDGSSYTGDESGDEVDGTSPATIAQVSELLNYVYGKTSVAGQIDRVSTIMRAYEGREAVLLELLETKALIKANADSNRDETDMPLSLRNSPGLNNNSGSNSKGQQSGSATSGSAPTNRSPLATVGESSTKLTPQTPLSVNTTPTRVEYPAGLTSPNMVTSPSPSATTFNTFNTKESKNTSSAGNSNSKDSGGARKKKGLFSFFKKDKKMMPTGPQSIATKTTASPGGKSKLTKTNRKGPQVIREDDRSI
jgi:hypothetical protein